MVEKASEPVEVVSRCLADGTRLRLLLVRLELREVEDGYSGRPPAVLESRYSMLVEVMIPGLPRLQLPSEVVTSLAHGLLDLMTPDQAPPDGMAWQFSGAVRPVA
jgi:hypothetical protein